MASTLECGKLQLTPEEVETYRAAAQWLHERWEIALDLTQPIDDMDWYRLGWAKAALAGDFKPIADAAAAIEAELKSRGVGQPRH
jgi:hypothetical protein